MTAAHTIRPLDASTWDVFAELVERNNGIFGGCWCIGYHPECGQRGISYRAVKEDRVRAGRAHAALVIDEDGTAQGWCQYGSPEELPGIKHKREYDKDAPPTPDWRITCFYVDKKHRGRGIARAALEGALEHIAAARGRARRGDPRGDDRTHRPGPVPLQRHGRTLRAARLHPHPPGRQARMGHEQDDRPNLTHDSIAGARSAAATADADPT